MKFYIVYYNEHLRKKMGGKKNSSVLCVTIFFAVKNFLLPLISIYRALKRWVYKRLEKNDGSPIGLA